MAKALGTLIFRGIVGVMSIAVTAIVTVLVQHYLYAKTGTPALILAPNPLSTPQPAPSEAEAPPLETPPQAPPTDSTVPDVGATTSTEANTASKEQGDRPTQIMKQFWDKLNH